MNKIKDQIYKIRIKYTIIVETRHVTYVLTVSESRCDWYKNLWWREKPSQLTFLHNLDQCWAATQCTGPGHMVPVWPVSSVRCPGLGNVSNISLISDRIQLSGRNMHLHFLKKFLQQYLHSHILLKMNYFTQFIL